MEMLIADREAHDMKHVVLSIARAHEPKGHRVRVFHSPTVVGTMVGFTDGHVIVDVKVKDLRRWLDAQAAHT